MRIDLGHQTGKRKEKRTKHQWWHLRRQWPPGGDSHVSHTSWSTVTLPTWPPLPPTISWAHSTLSILHSMAHGLLSLKGRSYFYEKIFILESEDSKELKTKVKASASGVGVSDLVCPPSLGVADGWGELGGAGCPPGTTNQPRGAIDPGRGRPSFPLLCGEGDALPLCFRILIHMLPTNHSCACLLAGKKKMYAFIQKCKKQMWKLPSHLNAFCPLPLPSGSIYYKAVCSHR